MKTIKKLLALTLVLCMVFCLSVAVFADGETTPSDQSTVTIKKVYKLANAGTTSPAETFTLEQIGDGTVTSGDATSAPALGTITGAVFAEGAANVADGAKADITVTLPAYERVGVYEYTLKEVVGTTAGVTYYGNPIKLVVSVINGANNKLRIAAVHTETNYGQEGWEKGNKSSEFVNTYSAGTLNISKTVDGNLGDRDKYFEFKVTLNGVDGKTYGESYAVTGGSNISNPTSIKIGDETTFYLKNGDTLSIANLPYDVSYTVTETAAEGYTTTKTGDTGTIDAAEQTAAFTNTKNGDIDTGITLDSLPYILALAVAFGGAVVLFTRKRHVED